MNRSVTQRQLVEALLRANGRVSAHELTYQHGITRAGAIIHLMRRDGWDITTHNKHGEQAVYELVHPPLTTPPAQYQQTTLFAEAE